MSGDTKILDQNPDSVSQINPAQPTGSMLKEQAPIGQNFSETVKPSETEPQINQELADLGVEAKKDEPNITDEHKGAIEHAKQFTPIPSGSTGKVKLPMSEDEVIDKLKTGQDDDSGKWLSKLIQKIMKVMGL